MKTERTLELLATFKRDGIRHEGRGLQNVVDFQDCIMGATPSELSEFESSFTKDERRNFIWCIFSTLDKETALDIINKTTLNRIINAERLSDMEEYSAREKALYEKQEAFRLEKGGLENELTTAKKRIEDLEEYVKDLKDENESSRFFEEEAQSLRTIKSILNG